MYQVGKFEKVSFKEFSKYIAEDNKREVYNNLKLPIRTTKGSEGYDFYIPTAIKVIGLYKGVFLPYGITYDDNVEDIRIGGMEYK